MPINAPNLKDVFFLIPHIVLTVWGLLVLLVDLALARRMGPTARRNAVGGLSLVGVAIALAGAVFVCLVPLTIRRIPTRSLPGSRPICSAT